MATPKTMAQTMSPSMFVPSIHVSSRCNTERLPILSWNCEVRGHCMCKEMPAILVDRVVDKKRLIGKNLGPRSWPPPPPKKPAPWRRVAVDIESASGTRRPWFESHQGIRFLGKHSSAVVYKITYNALFVCWKMKLQKRLPILGSMLWTLLWEMRIHRCLINHSGTLLNVVHLSSETFWFITNNFCGVLNLCRCRSFAKSSQ
jgi:hypothetical protein